MALQENAFSNVGKRRGCRCCGDLPRSGVTANQKPEATGGFTIVEKLRFCRFCSEVECSDLHFFLRLLHVV